MNVIVMAGTRDARRIIEKLSRDPRIDITATATTEYGAELAESSGALRTVRGPLDRSGLSGLIDEIGAELLIDATHPFAAGATENALLACHDTGITYLRFERPLLDVEGVIRVDSFREAGEVASSLLREGEVAMHLAGVSTLPEVLESLDPERVAVRVLPQTSSIEACHRLGVPPEQIIAMQGTFSPEMNRVLMKEYRAGAVITKDSGETGGLREKVAAASELGIPIILVERPRVDLKGETVFHDINELVEYVTEILNKKETDNCL
ncbi:precorrin-6A reductase [Methanothermobacter sp. DP]|uniref:precorrin-6A reductase n=1 Tax=Methanothermobacter sp. DP TaxID=2998972 RepID=UPI002AA5D85D|nr:precorrin-6A reductase [Methanothermobacter sp. DP]